MIEFRESLIALCLIVALGAGFSAVAPASWSEPLSAVTAAAAATAESGVCHLAVQPSTNILGNGKGDGQRICP